MASSLLALLDDITTVLDDVAVLTKLAAKKSAGVLGDDLALNAQQVAGVQADRELPVVWAVAKGSFVNKAILVPSALLISAFAPWAVTPLLMVGGLFLCYEGVEKVAHRLIHGPEEVSRERAELVRAVADPAIDLLAFERNKIKGAVRTDLVLSAEIIAITLGTVAESTLIAQVSVLTGIALLMTVGVYGFVAAVVKLDDAGLYLSRRTAAWQRALGVGIVRAAPLLLRALSFAGTVLMLVVGGGILSHGIAPLHQLAESVINDLSLPTYLATLAGGVLDGAIGLLAGAVVLPLVTLGRKLFGRRTATPNAKSSHS